MKSPLLVPLKLPTHIKMQSTELLKPLLTCKKPQAAASRLPPKYSQYGFHFKTKISACGDRNSVRILKAAEGKRMLLS
jgi:hypothetical protein